MFNRLDFYDTILDMPKVDITCLFCNKVFNDYSFKDRKFCSLYCSQKSGVSHRGHKHTQETKDRISATQKDNAKIRVTQFKPNHKLWDHPNVKKNWIKKGSKPSNWQGGVRTKSEKIKDDKRYKVWRFAVFKRDGFKCVWCGEKKTIQADHIFSKTKYPEKAFDIDNGRTLCDPCHKKTPNYGGKAVTYENPLC